MPNAVIALGEKFGRLINYGDGLYAGQFIGALYAEAFFEKDICKVVEAALRSIPDGSTYAEMVRDMLAWSKQYKDWEKCWEVCNTKYGKPEYRQHSTQNPCIDCRINGAYVVMGLLYGEGDPVKTMTISMRCGLDSDCNPSSSGGVACTAIGMAQLPKGLMDEPNQTAIFSHTVYTFPKLLDVSEKLARQIIVSAGGRIEKDASGEEVFVIPVAPIKPSKLEKSWAPGPIANSRFTEAEMAQLTCPGSPAWAKQQADAMTKVVEKFAPGWAITNCGIIMAPGLHTEERGRKNVLLTHPRDKDTACVLSRKVDIHAGKKTTLKLTVGHHPEGDWDLVVRADMREVLRKTVGKATATNGWLDVTVDLSEYAGKSVLLELYNQPTGWFYEAGYWAKISIETD
ncbi:MAG: ADP-ribosylglycohydrolase family protein [Thermoguttaceae bacterium]|jgi:hypothetical protein